ncbi:flagellar hook-length control protein FliK [Bacillus sp. FJAT-42315]|uniref:flagellar hook-length control protein FliK n=1 Tax=Bacillus sp. FJAT-42315 TaxID=2014077 RepID=UPI000C25084E|nr:flagellar hook-length control protein FliK [Bacillus sp. FJAT-42315]
MIGVGNIFLGGSQINQAAAPKQAGLGSSFQLMLKLETSGLSATVQNEASQLLEAIKQIINTKNIDELTGIAPGVKPLAKEWMSDGKMPSFEEIALFLGMNPTELQSMIEKLMKQFTNITNGNDVAGQVAINEDPPTDIENPTDISDMLSVIQLLTTISPQDWPKAEGKLVNTLLQAAKVWELFSEKADSNTSIQEQQQALKSILKELSSKLDGVLQQAFKNYQHVNQEQALSKEEIVIQPIFQPLSKVGNFTMMVPTNPKPMNMEQFIEKFSQILNNSNLMKTPNGNRLLIKLYPEQLGSLRIELLQQNGVMTAKILSSTSMVKDLFEQHVHSLKHAFTQQNITVDKIELAHSQADPQKFDRPSQQEQQTKQQQQQSQQKETEDQPVEQFKDVLENMEV